jgi:DNA-directed RNA polymerase subunit F|tara:strand:- start:2761 stop:3063 length:303 start_codon:yes stop_codon:yes gene_type:complete
MTIKEEKPITMAEVVSLAGDSDKGMAIKSFIKNFNKMPLDKALKMKKDLADLDLIRLKDTHIVKIVDFMPSGSAELNKIVMDVSLDQEEITKILDVVGRY